MSGPARGWSSVWPAPFRFRRATTFSQSLSNFTCPFSRYPFLETLANTTNPGLCPHHQSIKEHPESPITREAQSYRRPTIRKKHWSKIDRYSLLFDTFCAFLFLIEPCKDAEILLYLFLPSLLCGLWILYRSLRLLGTVRPQCAGEDRRVRYPVPILPRGSILEFISSWILCLDVLEEFLSGSQMNNRSLPTINF